MRNALLLLTVFFCGCSDGLVTTEEQICGQAAATSRRLVGQWLITIPGVCEGSMKLEQEDPLAAGVWGCAKDAYSRPTYAGTVRIGPSAGGVGLVFTAEGFMEGQVLRGTLSRDGKTFEGIFDNHGDAPAMGASLLAVRER